MGVIKASIEYSDSIERVRNELNLLEQQCYKLVDSRVRDNMVRQCQILHQEINWLDDDKEVLFEAIDKALEKR